MEKPHHNPDGSKSRTAKVAMLALPLAKKPTKSLMAEIPELPLSGG
jgi:hypothetical protein